MTQTALSTIQIDELNLDEVVELQKSAFSALLSKNNVGFVQTPEYYSWKYSPPLGKAWIAQVRENSRLVAMNAMFPLALCHKGGKIIVWQSCDSATAPKNRGQGHFMNCLRALREKIKSDEIFFGFPNSNSAPGFKKFGWIDRGCLTTSVRVLPALKKIGRSIKKIYQFNESQNQFFSKLVQLGGPILERDSNYMNWRYTQRPDVNYHLYISTDSLGDQDGLLVFREVDVNGHRTIVIMECFGLTDKITSVLSSFAVEKANELKRRLVLKIANDQSTFQSMKDLYIPVPSWLLPKRQILMGAGYSPSSEAILNQKWRSQIGDWDGF